MEKHVMDLIHIYPSGAEEWFCPHCNLRFIMTWPPHFHKIILEEGDCNANHLGSKGDLEMYPSTLSSNSSFEFSSDEEKPDHRLDVWEQYIVELEKKGKHNV